MTFDASDLFIVTDFDKTLTKAYVNGKPGSTGPGVFRNGGYIHPDYVAASKALHAKYGPIEIDPALTAAQRTDAMNSWWREHLALFVHYGLTLDIIKKAAADGQIQLKDGAKEFFSWAHANNVPILIFSAGFAQVIEEHLRPLGLLTPNVHIHANRWKFDASGKAVGFESDVITSVNKASRSPLSGTFAAEVDSRKTMLLLGDTMDDVGMAEHFPAGTNHKVCFLTSDTAPQRDRFEKIYDQVLETDSLDSVLALLKG